jgi:DNA (cytosine-5)-methyltransferase 1
MSIVDSRPFHLLSLCTGAGGLDLGIKLAVPTARTICAVEIEAYACEILASRMEDTHLDDAPIWTNLRTFDGTSWRGTVDCITGGYPCQPFSVAGKQRGKDDPRHLWPDVARIVAEIEPAFCFFENVGNHLRLGFDEVAGELRGMGYEVAAGLFTAEEIGAPHKRERLFILAHAPVAQSGRDREHRGPEPVGRAGEAMAHPERRFEARGSSGCSDPSSAGAYGESAGSGALVVNTTQFGWGERRAEHVVRSGRDTITLAGSSVADSQCVGRQISVAGGYTSVKGARTGIPPFPPGLGDIAGWQRVLTTHPELAPALSRAESELYGMANGLADRVDRLRACGNGVVPDVAAFAFRTLYRDLMDYCYGACEEADVAA